jgi:5-methylcytosine-specific restriction endonuclease McrA
MVSRKDLNAAKTFLRRAFMMSGLRRDAMRTGRLRIGVYQCLLCAREYGRDAVQIDHVAPVVDPSKGFVDWNTYMARLYCDPSNLRVLCKDCHKAKTVEENGQRKLYGTGVWSKETRTRNSEARKGRPPTKARLAADKVRNVGRKRPVVATDIRSGSTLSFNSIREAGQELGISPINISRICRNKCRIQSGGYTFRYADTVVQKV